jgi:hypothetical protein
MSAVDPAVDPAVKMRCIGNDRLRTLQGVGEQIVYVEAFTTV